MMRRNFGFLRADQVRGIGNLTCSLVCLVWLSSCATLNKSDATPVAAASQEVTSPEAALAALAEGNERFVMDRMIDRDLQGEVLETAGGQKPFAIVLGCIDSRVPPEVVFDQGIGDIFSARIAGNFVNEDLLGSMEFATAVAGAKLLVVLGHSECGAIKGATDGAELGNLTAMLQKLEPAVAAVEPQYGERTSKNGAFVNRATELNVIQCTEAIKAQSPVIAELVDNGALGIVGAMYDVSTGKVSFYPESGDVE